MMVAALLMVSLLPIWFYHRRVLSLSESKLEQNEPLTQQEITRLLAREVQLYEATIHQRIVARRQMLLSTGLADALNDPRRSTQITALLEDLIKESPEIIYVTALGQDARGLRAGDARTDTDPFIRKALTSGFTVATLGKEFHSEPLSYESNAAYVLSLPLAQGGQFKGMIAAVVVLDHITERLRELSLRGRTVYVVDSDGRVVAHPERRLVPGTDLSTNVDIVRQYKELAGEARLLPTTSRFTMEIDGRRVDMMGTYSPVSELHWAVVAQRSLEDARDDAGINELGSQARQVMVGVVFVALLLGYVFAVAITTPIRGLAQSTRAISRGEFHERASVHGAAEISDLAETFNKMADDIGNYIERLKQAAEENRELFIGSIRMLAAAIDEKDPYTRGHSGRVAKYSVLVGEELGLSAEDLDRLRIAALLHDVGKIGVDDRVLKKPGSLTPEEFELMKQHPQKGANIMRPVVQLKEMLPGIELHHEHIDGRGYPYGLRGDQIPMMARIIAAADTLDAMTTNRPYQTAKDVTEAMAIIVKLAGTKFDPDVVRALEAVIASGRLRVAPTLVEV